MSCKRPRAIYAGLRPVRSSLQLTAGLALLVWLPGCRGYTPSETNAPVVLRVGQALPRLAEDAGIRQLVNTLTGERLIGLTNDGRFEPRLAERWTRSEDGLTWTFTLRPNLQFHDGSALDAGVAATILRSDVSRSTSPGLLDVDGIAARDAHTLVVTLRRPSAIFLDDLSANSLKLERDGAETGSGPFVVEGSGETRFVLRAFDHYYAGRPGLDRIQLTAYPSVRSAWSAMMRGEIDVLFEVGRDAIEFVEAESSVSVYAFPRAFVLALGFNQRHPALRNPAVRRAVNLAIDRERIVRETRRGHGLVADGFMWPYHWAIDRTVPAYGFDPALARKLLDEAGFAVNATTSGPVRFEIGCLVPADMAEYDRLGLVVQKNLYDVGINLQLEPLSTLALTRRLGEGTFDTFLFEMGNGRTLSWPYRFLHSPQQGQPTYARWGYASTDATLDRIRYAKTDDEVRAGVGELQRILYDDPPAAFIAWDERARAVRRRFEVPNRPGYDVFTTALLWQWKPARELR